MELVLVHLCKPITSDIKTQTQVVCLCIHICIINFSDICKYNYKHKLTHAKARLRRLWNAQMYSRKFT